MALSRKAFVWCLVLAALAFRATGQFAHRPIRMEMSSDAMGSTFSIVLYGNDKVLMEQAANESFAEARRLDRELSNYKPDSELTLVNQQAANHRVKITPELFDLLTACADYSRQSSGAFDITIGPLMKVWGFYNHAGAVPPTGELAKARSQVGYRHVHLYTKTKTVSFDRTGVELDLGGIGKGYAVDQMVEILKRKGIDTALVSASRSSIYGLGAPPTEPRGWPVTIDSSPYTNSPPFIVYLRNLSLSTSGIDQKFFRAHGRIYGHIMDPRTGHPARGSALVSVIAPRTIDSETWTKPIFINGTVWAATNVPKLFRVLFCSDEQSPNCRWVPLT